MVAVSHSSDSTFADLRQEVERLGQLRLQLVQQLTDSADRLEGQGILPAATLVDDLLTYRQRLQKVVQALNAGPVDQMSLHDVERTIETRDYRQAADAVLNRLTNLVHIDLPDFAPLALCQREASRLRDLATNGSEPNSELESLRNDSHPLNALLRLCEEGEQLTDVDWAECHDSVAATYGRQLATALTRGRIRKQARPIADCDVTPEPVREVPAISLPPELVFDPLPGNETIFDVAPPAQSSALRLRMAAIPLELTNPLSAIDPQSPQVAEVANLPPANPPASRRANSVEQIVRFMTEDQLPLALHLTRCLELRQDHTDGMPPSWLLRAMILSRHLSYSKGEIARQLDDELREFRVEMLTEGSNERQLMMAFLLRSVAIPAALLAGSSQAVTILRSFKITPGFSHLYNYCSRIALYGDRLAGNLVELFRPTGTIAGAAELDELSVSTQTWLQETAKKAVGYTRTSPLFLHAHWTLSAGTASRHADATTLWCKWQETLSLAHRLLKPVCNRADGERNWVRQEIARLSSQVRIEPVEQTLRAGAASSSAVRGIVLPLEEMHAVIQEAIAIANRWLRLCHQTATSGGSPVPLEALELRDEIMQRSEGVLGELTMHRQTAESAWVKAAIACCQNAVKQMHALFESKSSLPLVESDPRHVLNADLLRVPGLELNDQWVPDADVALIERELMSGTELSWRQSYDYHAQTGNHEATGRLLDLDVWSSEDERETLRKLRQTQIVDSRRAANTELDELAVEFGAVARANPTNEIDIASIQIRIERLRLELPRVTNFALFRRQISHLQSTISRCRRGTAPASMPLATVVTTPVSQSWHLASPPMYHEPIATSCDIFSGE